MHTRETVVSGICLGPHLFFSGEFADGKEQGTLLSFTAVFF